MWLISILIIYIAIKVTFPNRPIKEEEETEDLYS